MNLCLLTSNLKKQTQSTPFGGFLVYPRSSAVNVKTNPIHQPSAGNPKKGHPMDKTQFQKRTISLKCRFWWKQGDISGSDVFA